MTIGVKSGRTGYLKTILVFPPSDPFDYYANIHSWSISTTQHRSEHRISHSAPENYPTRRPGTLEDTITIHGTDPSTSLLNFWRGTNVVNFQLGYYDLALEEVYTINCVAMLKSLKIQFIYHESPEPSFSWTADFTAVITSQFPLANTILTVNDTGPYSDPTAPVCLPNRCNFFIVSTDYPPGPSVPTTTLEEVTGVRSAIITFTNLRPMYRTSDSGMRPRGIFGTQDVTVELEVEENFDYWTELINNVVIQPREYRFGWGPILTPEAQIVASSVIPTRLSDFTVNVMTGEIVRAKVTLEASGLS